VGLIGTLSGLNPLTDLDPTLRQIAPLLYQTLNQLDHNTAQPLPLVADPVDIDATGLILRYQLTPSTSLTAADVEASFQAADWPELTSIRRVTAETGDQFSISLTVPDCSLVDRLAEFPILPAASIADDRLVGSGPFRVERWDVEQGELQLQPNPAYQPAPFLAALTIRFFEDEASAWAALEAGELDLLSTQNLAGSLPAGYKKLAYEMPLLLFTAFNHQDEITSQVEVRRALSVAVDRARLLARGVNGEGKLATGFLPDKHWATNLDLAVPDFEPEQAMALLDQVRLVDQDGDGWRDRPDGTPWSLAIRARSNRPQQANLAFLVADDLRRIGLHARVELLHDATILDDLLTHDYQVTLYGLTVRPELDYYSYWHSDTIEAELGLNLPAYSNPQVDNWLDTADDLPGCAADERADLYRQIQAQLVDDQAVDFLMFPNAFLIYRANLSGLAPGPFAPFTWNAAEWYLD
jgi:peptide/nickel transport system substrate-binding protein